MKFKNPETGEVYSNILVAMDFHCDEYWCYWCQIKKPAQEYGDMKNPCSKFCVDHPEEAARLMGYEVIEDKQKEKGDKPRICEILGVDVGERFKSPLDCADICIKSDGFPVFPDHENDTIPARYIVALINDPDSIIRKPRFTKQEIEDAKTLIRICPENLDSITRTKDGDILLSAKGAWRERLASSAFSSLAPGQTVRVQDIIENSEQES